MSAPTPPVMHRVPHRDDAAVEIAVDDVAPPSPKSTAFFLPGFGSVRNGEKATLLARALPARGVRFLALDFQGLGDSGGEFRTLTLSRQLRDYASVRDAVLEGERHVLIGSSMGGLVASMAAARDPENVTALVLIAPAFGFRARFERQIGERALAEWERTGNLAYRGEYFSTDLAFDLLRDARTLDEVAIARSITQPVLLLHGDADATVPIEHSERIAREIEAPLEFVRIAGGSHRLENHLDELAERVGEFVRRGG